MSGKQRRQQRRHERRLRRIEKNERVRLGRQNTRNSIRTRKWDALETGYVHGIDGRANVSNAIADSVGHVASAATSMYGGRQNYLSEIERAKNLNSPKSPGDMGVLAIVIAAFYLFFS